MEEGESYIRVSDDDPLNRSKIKKSLERLGDAIAD